MLSVGYPVELVAMNESDPNSTYRKLQTGEVHIYPEVGTRHGTRNGDGEITRSTASAAQFPAGVEIRAGKVLFAVCLQHQAESGSSTHFFAFPFASLRAPTIDVMRSRLRVQVQRCGQLGILGQNG